MIASLAKMLGLTAEHAEASMHSERAARAVLTRRNLFAAGAALAAGSAFSFAEPEVAGFWVINPKLMGEQFSDLLRYGELFNAMPFLGETEAAFRKRLICQIASPLCHRLPQSEICSEIRGLS